MRSYTVNVRQIIEYQAVIEAETAAVAIFEAKQECRKHGIVVDTDIAITKEEDIKQPFSTPCVSDGMTYTTNPIQKRCKNCGMMWFPSHGETPLCAQA